MAKIITEYVCQSCGHRAPKWLGKCPECEAWNSLAEEKTKGTVSEGKKFEIEFPKNQKFDKTDLAKYLNSWEDKPHIVSKGAQKNFSDFILQIDRNWEEKKNLYNEHFYRELIGKAIIFKEVEKLVSNQIIRCIVMHHTFLE